jgi:dTDP-L-rhamnose 4-epimerase
MGRDQVVPHVTGKYRAGDIRHCFADISRAGDVLAFAPEMRFEQGIGELVEWLKGQVATDSVDKATAELSRRGLVA